MRSSAFHVRLSRALARSAGARRALIKVLRAWFVGVQVAALRWDHDADADAGAGVALVGQGRQALGGGRVQRGQCVFSGER